MSVPLFSCIGKSGSSGMTQEPDGRSNLVMIEQDGRIQSGGAGLKVQSGGVGLEVQSEGAGLEGGGEGLEVQSGVGLEVQSDGMEMNLPIDLSQDHRYSFTHGFASFCGRPGGFSLSPAMTSQEVDNSINELVRGEISEENLCSNVTGPLASGSWEVRFNDFMAKFERTDRSSTTFDDIAPSLSGSQSLFEGRKVPSEFVLPLTSLAAKYSGGNLSSLFKEDNSLHQRHILTKELGYVLFSMEHESRTIHGLY
ncbi:hypothetical protein M0R45_006823 [Rubus argutus]|uniref:Uncharacterized protein n=1 Tax=Rubus argutus TaxID=59490 RepID=A0AAW1YRN8_RUBAR